MKQKLTLALALFVFAVATSLGVGLAAAATGATGPVGPEQQPAAPTQTPQPAPPATVPAPPPVESVTEPPPPSPQPQPKTEKSPEVTRNDAIGGSKKPSSGSTKGRGSDRAGGKGKKGATKDGEAGKKKRSGGKQAGDDEKKKKQEPEDEASEIFGPAPIAVPNPVLDSFEIPPFLLPIYQACGTQYAIPWQLLAAINKIETAFGTNLSVSTAGAMGWMQFMPGTWASYGVDANGDGRKDPYNPVDAICAAARYLRAAGGTERLRQAVFAYNHANWYVDDVLAMAKGFSQVPVDLISSLTGLTEGAHFPVAANARYADQVTVKAAIRRAEARQRGGDGNAAEVLSSSPGRKSVTIFSRPQAPVVAVNDGVIKAIGHSKRLGRYVVLEDAYGNRFTYAGLSHLMKLHPVPKRETLTESDFEMVTPDGDKMPAAPASKTGRPATEPDPEEAAQAKRNTRLAERIARRSAAESEHDHEHGRGADADPARHDHDDGGQGRDERDDAAPGDEPALAAEPVNTEDARNRIYARPDRPNNVDRAALSGQLDHEIAGSEDFEAFRASPGTVLRYDSEKAELKPLGKGSQVIAGTLLGRASKAAGPDDGGKIQFSIRPAGKGAPQIDPKPILDGWRLLEATEIYRARRSNPFFTGSGVGQVLMLPKSALIRRVLNDPRLEIYSCGREDIASGSIDRRVLALLSYLVERGYRLTITSLTCGHGYLTTSGNVSNHSLGRAVDIAVINGVPVYGHQGPGSITEAVVKEVLRLQGTMVPSELISLSDLGGPSFAMADHADHIHVGYSAGPSAGEDGVDGPEQILKPGQWTRLMDRLGEIENPSVPQRPSAAATPAGSGSSPDPDSGE